MYKKITDEITKNSQKSIIKTAICKKTVGDGKILIAYLDSA